MRFCVLGPLEAHGDRGPVAIGGGHQRALLALLLVHAGEVVSRGRLIEELWRGAPPAGAPQSLDAYLSRLRRALREAGASGILATRHPGYVLLADETDAAEFEATVRAGSQALASGDYQGAASLLRDGLAMWRGNAYVEVADDPWAQPEAERLEELRLAALEDRIDAEMALGRHAALVPELELLATRHPIRERLVGQLMLALYRCGRQAEALATYQLARRALVEELGVEPGRTLRRLEAAVLTQDRALDLTEDVASYRPLGGRITLGRETLEDERKQVTVLVANAAGSVALDEQVDPEELRQVMQRFLSILCTGVHRLEGTVDTFTGNGITALFGAPIAHEDHGRRACYAALHIKHEVSIYAAELRPRGLGLSVRMGLNSGEVVVGAIGDDRGMEYKAIGHTVTLAQQMHQLAEPDTVYLTPNTARLAEGYFSLNDLGELPIADTSRPLHVQELIGVGPAQGALDVARARGFSRFVGRDEELQILEVAREQAFAGQGQVIGIVGEAGVGKSRLCHEFAERQRNKGIPIYHVGGQAHTKSVPLLPVLQFLRAYFEITERDSDIAARERIVTKLADLDEAFDDDLPLIFDLLGVSDPEQPVELMDPEARQRRLLSFMKRLSRARNARQPAVTVVEDLHWLDPASEAFLVNEVNAVRGTRGLTVVNFRPEYHASWMAHASYRQIALGRLDPKATEEMLAELLGSDPSISGLGELLGDRSQGNPFFIEELVRSLVEIGTLEGAPGAYRLRRPVDEATVPATVQAVLAARIDRLPSQQKAVLQAAAVIGREFPRPVLERVVTIPPAQLADVLGDLMAADFIYDEELYPEARYMFKHPLTREVAYQAQLTERRAILHATVAQAIIEEYPERVGERAALLAQHWETAGETLEAARWHARAAAWSGSGDPDPALRHWRKVRELADALPASPEVVALRLQARIASLNFGWRLGLSHEETNALFRETQHMATQLGDIQSQALLLFGYAAASEVGEGDHCQAAQLSRQALALAEQSGDPALYVAVSLGAYMIFATGAYREAVAICQRAIELANGDPAVGSGIVTACPYASSHAFQALAMTALGELDPARRLFDQAAEIARNEGDIEVVGWSHMWSVWLAYFRGDPEAASAHAQQAVEIAGRMGGSFSRSVAWFHRGGAHWIRGEWRQAIAAIERSQAIAAGRHREHDGWRLAVLAESHLSLGDSQRAQTLAAEAVEIAHTRGNRFEETFANLALARVLRRSVGMAARTDIEAALHRALTLSLDTDAKAFEPLIHVELAELAGCIGDDSRRERELGEAYGLFTQIGAIGHLKALADQPADEAGPGRHQEGPGPQPAGRNPGEQTGDFTSDS